LKKSHYPLLNKFPEGQYLSFKPTDELRPFIEEFWIHELNSYCLHDKTELELPNLLHEITFKFGQDYIEYYPKNKTSKTQSSSTVYGVRTFAKSSKRTNFNNSLFLVGIKFKPLGIYSLLNIPLNKLHNQSITFSELKTPILEELEQELSAKKDSLEVISFLNLRLNEFYSESTISADALRFLNELNKSNLSYHSTITKNSEFHYKNLERKFKKFIGITPKRYFKTERFLSFYNSWQAKNQFKYIDLVYEHQYFDQSHLIKDFKSILGVSPNTFLKNINQSYTQNIRSTYFE